MSARFIDGVIPDALLALQLESGSAVLALEVDEGTEHAPVIKAKLARYAEALDSREGWHVMFVVGEPQRAGWIRRLAHTGDELRHAAGQAWVTSIDELRERGIRARITSLRGSASQPLGDVSCQAVRPHAMSPVASEEWLRLMGSGAGEDLRAVFFAGLSQSRYPENSYGIAEGCDNGRRQSGDRCGDDRQNGDSQTELELRGGTDELLNDHRPYGDTNRYAGDRCGNRLGCHEHEDVCPRGPQRAPTTKVALPGCDRAEHVQRRQYQASAQNERDEVATPDPQLAAHGCTHLQERIGGLDRHRGRIHWIQDLTNATGYPWNILS